MRQQPSQKNRHRAITVKEVLQILCVLSAVCRAPAALPDTATPSPTTNSPTPSVSHRRTVSLPARATSTALTTPRGEFLDLSTPRTPLHRSTSSVSSVVATPKQRIHPQAAPSLLPGQDFVFFEPELAFRLGRLRHYHRGFTSQVRDPHL